VFGAWLMSALGSAQRSTLLMDDLSPALAATLGLLTAALDEPGVDIAASVGAFGAAAAAAIGSYLGLTVSISGPAALCLTVWAPGKPTPVIRASLRIPMPNVGAGTGVDGAAVGVDLVVYAGRAGAFVDVAADLSWLTGRDLSDFDLDEHLHLPVDPDDTRTLLTASLIDQAIGVLIGRGHTLDQARRELDVHAARTGTDRAGAAAHIVTTLTPSNPEPDRH
jgi:hypothetical protein